ncbi:hypothetical protein SB773_33315, partial [Bacillus sp. SIMBA_074]
TKVADRTIIDPAASGDAVTYTFTLTDTGDTTLTDVTIHDAMAGLSPVTVTWPAAPGTLLPGQTATATAHYAVTAADVALGAVI